MVNFMDTETALFGHLMTTLSYLVAHKLIFDTS